MTGHRPTLADWLAFDRYPNFTKARWLGGLISVAGTIVVLVLVGLALFRFFLALSGIAEFEDAEAQSAAIRNNGLVVAALIGVPFLIWRTSVAQKQVDTAQEALFNDKINAASEDLHAMRQRWDGEQNIWEDDIVRRNAAIDRLEGLAEERPDVAPRIARMLSLYVRQLSLSHPPSDLAEAERSGIPFGDWLSGLKISRSDSENAVQVLGRLKSIENIDESKISIDLRGANLQLMDLSSLDLSSANLSGANTLMANFDKSTLKRSKFSGAKVDATSFLGTDLSFAVFDKASARGSHFNEAEMTGADLNRSNFGSAEFIETNLCQATFIAANLEGASFVGAKMQLVGLSGAKLQSARFNSARLQGSKIYSVQIDRETSFENTSFRASALRGVNLSDVEVAQDQIEDFFCDGTVVLPNQCTKGQSLKDKLKLPEFETQWRAWQKSIGFDPEDPSTWDSPSA